MMCRCVNDIHRMYKPSIWQIRRFGWKEGSSRTCRLIPRVRTLTQTGRRLQSDAAIRCRPFRTQGSDHIQDTQENERPVRSY